MVFTGTKIDYIKKTKHACHIFLKNLVSGCLVKKARPEPGFLVLV